MEIVRNTMKGIVAAAVLGAVAFTGTGEVARAQGVAAGQSAAQPAAQQKKVKDQGEYDIYNQALKDLNTDPAKAIQDLDTWTQKYPDSDYKDDRLYFYMQAYSKLNPPQPAKVLEYGQKLMSKDLNTVFTGPDAGRTILSVLYMVAWNTATLPNATPEQLAAGNQAARQLLEFAPKYFVESNKPSGTSEAQWTAAREDIEKRAKAAMGAMAVIPANQALEKKDCAGAVAGYTKALADYPDNASISYNLGRALNCQAKAEPDKAIVLGPQAIYEFVRAAVVDPTLGGSADPKKITDYANSVYVTYHGSDEGLDQLKQTAKASPLPPAGFTIETASAVAAKKEKEFAEKNPQLALWMGIKRQLTDTNGAQYFEGQLKDANVTGQSGARALKGTVVEGKPACRSKEVLVAIPEPGQTGNLRPEITLKLDAALTGKPVPGQTIEWDGVPTAFSRDPFMLTMDTEKAKITGLKVEPCTAAGTTTRRPAAKKGAKKK